MGFKEPDEYWVEKVKSINPGLFIVWNGLFNKWQILHKCPKTSQVRKVMFVNNPDGGYMDMNDKVLYYLRTSVRWDLVSRYENVNDMLDEMDRENEAVIEAYKRKRLDDINVLCHEDRRLWSEALEEAKSGRWGNPIQPDKKIMLDLGGEK